MAAEDLFHFVIEVDSPDFDCRVRARGREHPANIQFNDVTERTSLDCVALSIRAIDGFQDILFVALPLLHQGPGGIGLDLMDGNRSCQRRGAGQPVSCSKRWQERNTLHIDDRTNLAGRVESDGENRGVLAFQDAKFGADQCKRLVENQHTARLQDDNQVFLEDR